MSKRIGGFIPMQTEPSGPYQDGAAPGVWSLQEAFTYTKAGLWPTAGNVLPPAAGTAIYAGGLSTGSSVMQSIVITTLGNSSSFGSLYVGVSSNPAAAASSVRYLYAGGASVDGNTNIVQFGTFSGGTSSDFGDLTTARSGTGGFSNETRAVFGGANTAPQNVIDYVTIASEGNATDFGDLTTGREDLRGVSSPTRGVFLGGNVNVNDYVTIASTGNATDFGDLLSAATIAGGACSNSTRGIYAGGRRSGAQINVIQYITIASTGNSIDFGDLSAADRYNDGVSNATRAVFLGFDDDATMQYVTIASTGDTLDFGELSATGASPGAGTSNSHGGLS